MLISFKMQSFTEEQINVQICDIMSMPRYTFLGMCEIDTNTRIDDVIHNVLGDSPITSTSTRTCEICQPLYL